MGAWVRWSVLAGLAVYLGFSAMPTEAVTATGKVDFTEADDLNDDGAGEGGFVSVYKNYPKIQVTVDTLKLKRVPQPETKSDESSSGSSGSSGSESIERPSVGVRTDITIEISEESRANDTRPAVDDRVDGQRDRPAGSEGNRTPVSGGTPTGKKDRRKDANGETDGDGDNASIPVFKGTAGVSSRPKPPATRGPGTHGSRPGVTLSQRPTGSGSFYGSGGDDRNRISGEYDGWNERYPHPVTAVWTTERPYLRRADYEYSGHHQPTYYKGYIPYNVGHHGHHQPTESPHHQHAGDWKPCYCSIYQPWAARAPTNPVLPPASHPPAGPPPPPPPPRHKVDNKVDVPVSSQQQRQHYRSIRL